MEPSRHAFLIIAHRQFDILKKMLILLDHPRADFYIHIDRKAEFNRFEEFSQLLQYSRVHFIVRQRVNWGGYSQIRCELALIKSALPGQYGYYHLLSGADFPLKKMTEILGFFDKNEGKEFVHFDSPTLKPEFYERFRVYHPFQESAQRSGLISKLEWRLVNLQKKLGVQRNSSAKLAFGKGANWFSITGKFAAYLLAREKEIKKVFSLSRCCDEIFLQTVLLSSPYREALYDKGFDDNYAAVARLIDWKRGQPYTFTKADFAELTATSALFARKFDENIDSEIIEMLFSVLKE